MSSRGKTRESTPTRVTVVGLGLMGGSLAAALHEAGGWHVTGFDADPACRESIHRRGFVDACPGDLATAVAEAELIVLATPVRAVLDCLKSLEALAPAGSVVIDLGSTKRQICAAMDRLPERVSAIGGHPMAGRKTAGVGGASAGLFRERKFFLVDNRRTDTRARRLAARLVADIGAVPVPLDAGTHDRAMAMVSHAPHLLAVPLLLATEDADDGQLWALAAGGYRTATAAAVDNPAMWEDIAASNGDLVAEALRRIAGRIEDLARALESGDAERLSQALAHAARLYTDRLD